MKTIITIGRECGSGGREIGYKLASEFHIPFYDKEILERASKESGICETFFENNDEKRNSSFLYSLVMDSYSFSNPMSGYGNLPLNHRIFLAQFDTIKNIALDGPCVLVGRCADYALENHKDVLRIFISADIEDRIKRTEKEKGLSYTKAKDLVAQTDKQRSSYYNFYTNKKWGQADQYDLCINSSLFGIDGTVAAIKAFIDLKENQ